MTHDMKRNIRYILSLLFLLMCLGVGEAWGQTTDYSGVYYLSNQASTTYYLVPTINCFYDDDEDKPHLTTYPTKKDKNSIWRIERVDVGTETYYRIIHNATGKYLMANAAVSGLDNSNKHRKRVHLETLASLEGLDASTDKSLFTIVFVKDDKIVAIKSKNVGSNTNGDGDTHWYLNPQGGNKETYRADGDRKVTVTAGIIGFYGKDSDNTTKPSNQTGSQWKLEPAPYTCATPVIQYADKNTIKISYPISSDTGWTIYYTTDGTDPSDATNEKRTSISATATLTDLTKVSKVRAIATKTDWESSEEAVLITSGVGQIIQNKECEAFYMVAPFAEGETNATTTNIPSAAISWTFQPAGLYCGIQYYNILDKDGKYLYCSNVGGDDNALVMKETSEITPDEQKDRAKFRLLLQVDGSFKLISKWWAAEKPNNFIVTKKDGNDNTANINLSAGTDGKACWNIIAPDDIKSLSIVDKASTETDVTYIKIQSANATGYYVVPLTLSGGNATASNTSVIVNATNSNWYLLPATDGEPDEWVTYYNIRNGLTGEYLYFEGSAGADNTFFTSNEKTGDVERYKFIVVKGANTTYADAYNIIPKELKGQANQANNSLNRNNTTLKTQNSRNTAASLWNLVDGDYTVAPPYITYAPATNKATITCTTPGTTIFYTTNGMEPTPDSSNNGASSISFELEKDIMTVRAIAKKDDVLSSEVSKACLRFGNEKYVLQSVDCTDFYMTVGDLSGANTTVNTSSLPQAGMSWHFEDAGTANGIQYYYIYNTSAEAYLQRNGDNLYLTAKQETDAFKFDIVPYFDNGTFAGYNIHSKAVNKFVHKANGNESNSAVYLNAQDNEKRSRWNIISVANKSFTLPFALSDNNSATYYTFTSKDANTYLMSPPTASTGYVTTTAGTSDEQKWYFQDAGSDDWATFYYIRNAVSGEALCFVATPGTGTLSNALQMKSLPDTPTDDYKFALAKTTIDGEYYIIPKPLAQYAKASYAAVWREGTGALQTRYDRANSKIKWQVTEAMNYVAPPVITYDPATNRATINCTTPGVTISYTTDGTNASYNNEPFPLNEGATTITATAQKDNVSSNSTTITIAFQTSVGKDLRPYIIQSKDCQSYRLIPNVSIDETTKYVSTLNVPCQTMAWHFEYAEEGYFYIVDSQGWYMYYPTTDNTNKYVYLKNTNDKSDSFKFSITAHASGGFNLIPKNQTTSVNKDGGLTPAKLSGIVGDKASRWDLIPYNAENLPLWTTAPFESVSDDNNTYYYKIKSVSQTTKPIILNNSGDIKSETVPTTDYDARKSMWVIKKIEDNGDALLDFYTFQNAYTGELLYYNGNGRNHISSSGVLQIGKPSAGDAAETWSHFVIVQTLDSKYNIIPRVLVDQTKAIDKNSNNEAFNCLNRAQGGDVIGTYYDDGNGSRWTFELVENVKCMNPVFTQDEDGRITLSCVTNAAEILFTDNGDDPTAKGENLKENDSWGASSQHRIKAVAKLKNDESGTSMSSVVTLLNKPDITLAGETYTYKGAAWEPAVTKVSINETEAPTSPATYSVSYSNNINAGTATITLTDADPNDSWYIWNGATPFTIAQKELTITADNDTKEYDGTPLTKNSYTSSELAEGDSFESVKITGRQTDVGSSDNVPSAAVIKNASDEIMTPNYNITYVKGTLKVTKKSIGDGNDPASDIDVSIGAENAIILTYGDMTLTKGNDYTINEATISASGRYSSRTVTANEEGNYTGSFKARNAIVNFQTDDKEAEWSATFVAEPAGADDDPSVAADNAKGHALPDGITAYVITKIDGDVAVAEALDYVPEGIPVLLLSNAASGGFFVKDASGQTAITTEQTSSNLLKEVTDESLSFNVRTIYLLYQNEFVYNMAGDLEKGKVYLNPNHGIGGSRPAPSRLKIRINTETGTGIDNVTEEAISDTEKDSWFTLDGRRLNGKPQRRGLYITREKKVIVR